MITTGSRGRLSDKNLALGAGLSGGAWSATLTLANLIDPSYIARPARCLTPALMSASQFDVNLGSRLSGINVVGLLFHTMSIAAKWRISFYPVGGAVNGTVYITPWLPVYPRWTSTAAMAWEDADFWSGGPSGGDIDLFPRHALWVCPDDVTVPLCAVIRVEIDDVTTPSFDIGGLWLGSGWAPDANFERGRTLSLNKRDLVDEGPSGRLFGQARRARRQLDLQWRGGTDAEARRLFDAGARCGPDRPVLFIPDAGDAAATAREAFPATFSNPPAPKFNFSGTNEITASLQEIIA